MTVDRIKILNYNIQGKEGTYKDQAKQCKYSVLIPWAISKGYQLITLQETKASPGYITKQVQKLCNHATVLETSNPDNPNKGGVATISLDKAIRITLVEDDSETQSTWLQTVPAQYATEHDIGRGRYQTIQFQYKTKPVFITNICTGQQRKTKARGSLLENAPFCRGAARCLGGV